MSESIDRDTLTTLAVRTLEEAAFVFAEPSDEAPTWDAEVVVVALPFEGQRAGRMILGASPTFGADLAANLLGVEPEAPEATAKGTEALGEVLNILGGAYMQALFGGDPDRRMGVPGSRRVSGGELSAELETAACAVTLLTEEDQRIDLAVFVEG